MEFIKGNNQTTETKVKIVNALPVYANENDLVIKDQEGIYQYKNNSWNLIISFIIPLLPPIIGEIRASIGSPDNNWLLCNGSTFSSTTYPQLYSLLGSTTLPDFREVIPIGVGQNGTDSVVDHDTFTLGQKKDWNLQTHYHCKTENNHTHSLSATTFSHTHCSKNIVRTTGCYTYYCYYNTTYGGTTVCRTNTRAEGWTGFSVSTASWSTSPSIGNPSGGTAILRVNSYGVNFYIRAK